MNKPTWITLISALLAMALPSVGHATSIHSITPAVADRGELVTITGNGFGAENVEISVDHRAAEVVSATGSKATFRVPALAGPGKTTVKATNPGGQSGTVGLHVRFDGVSTPVLDIPRRVSATIGRGGGSLGSGGLTLTVPAGALSEDTTIALTPLLDLADSPLAGSIIGGVKLEPEGLIFLAPAALTMPLSAGVAPSEVLGFGSAGDGSELHLQPHTVAGGTITLKLWHFSTAGAAAGGAAAAAVMQTHQPSAAEQQALQRIAAAQQACQAELAAGVFSGPACANVRPEGVRALFDWYTNAVRPGLQAAGNAPSFVAEVSLADWLAWEAEVRLLFLNDPPPACGTLQSECVAAHGLATSAIGAHAQRRLDNCTGTSLASQLRDVARVADFAGAGAADLTTLNPPLPDATSGALLRACAHLEIAVTDFPAIAALNHANTLRGRVTVDVFTGPDRTDVPLTLMVDGSAVDVAPDGTFTTTLTPATAGLPLNVTLEAEATNPALQNTSFTATRNLTRPTRQRLLLVAQGPTTVPAGGTLNLLVLVAGDGMTDNVTLTVGGPGSVGPTPVTPNGQGEATAVYTAPSSTVNPDAQVIATLLDGTSATVPITIAVVVTVSLDPTSATLTAGGTQNFTATVANSTLGVTWSATGGAIVTTGSTTARYEARSTAGTFSVTATSIADPTKSATATVTITSATSARVRVLYRTAQASVAAQLDNAGGIHDNKNFAEEPPLAFGAVSHSAAVPGASADHFSRLLGTSSTLDADGNMSFSATEDHAVASSSFSVGFRVENAPLRYVLEATTTHSGLANCATDIILMDGETGVRLVSSGTAPATVSRRGTLSPGVYALVVGGGCRDSGSGGASFAFFVEP